MSLCTPAIGDCEEGHVCTLNIPGLPPGYGGCEFRGAGTRCNDGAGNGCAPGYGCVGGYCEMTCTPGSDECGPGERCVEANGGTCRSFGFGDPCNPGVTDEATCDDGLICNSHNDECHENASDTCCRHVSGAGESCTRGNPASCAGELLCLDDSEFGLCPNDNTSCCLEPAGPDGACDIDQPESCQAGLGCELFACPDNYACCKPSPRLGESCAARACAPGLTCVEGDVCALPGGPGDSCRPSVANSCQTGLQCAFDMACPDTFCCLGTPAEEGEACAPRDPHPCADAQLECTGHPSCTPSAGPCCHVPDPAAAGEGCDDTLAVPCEGELVCRVAPGADGSTCGFIGVVSGAATPNATIADGPNGAVTEAPIDVDAPACVVGTVTVELTLSFQADEIDWALVDFNDYQERLLAPGGHLEEFAYEPANTSVTCDGLACVGQLTRTMAGFRGQDADGAWLLRVYNDFHNATDGVLVSVSLAITCE